MGGVGFWGVVLVLGWMGGFVLGCGLWCGVEGSRGGWRAHQRMSASASSLAVRSVWPRWRLPWWVVVVAGWGRAWVLFGPEGWGRRGEGG